MHGVQYVRTPHLKASFEECLSELEWYGPGYAPSVIQLGSDSIIMVTISTYPSILSTLR